MKLLKVDDLDEARAKLEKFFGKEILSTQKLEVEASLGSILAKDIYCPIDLPHFRRSTVDGYAVQAKDTHGASQSIPVLLKLCAEVDIAEVPKHILQSGECIYVPTGGMIPENADSMVMVEYSEEFEDEIALYKSTSAGTSIVQIGEEFSKGELLLKAGTKIRAQEIGTLCAVDVREISVYTKMKVAIISSGNELLDKESPLSMAKVKDVNTYALSALATSLGMEIVSQNLVKDREEDILSALKKAQEMADIVLISGGSSKGKKDMTHRLLEDIAQIFTHGLALQPGKPTIIAFSEKSKTLFIGLPGHPVAAMMVFRLLIEWLFEKVYGIARNYPLKAFMQTNIPNAAGRESCILVEIREDTGTKQYTALPIRGKSGLISLLTRAYGYVRIEKNTEGVKAGELVSVYPV